jgi:hypothetical protein
MAQFGYELGLAAALGPNRLFEKFPMLHLVEYAPIDYPPLARQAQISGQLKFSFTVKTTARHLR